MLSRRTFLGTLASASVAPIFGPQSKSGVAGEVTTALGAPVGLQLWSLRDYLPKDLRGTLTRIRALGFREVEGAGLWKHTAADLRAALDAAGLRCQSAHMEFERLRDDAPGAFAEAKALGASSVVCPWIPDADRKFGREEALRTAEAFNKFAAAAEAAGLTFAYHCHGYEFVPSTEGTLFDTLAKSTDPRRVSFQIDVFHALYGGADPAALIDRYKSRVTSLHLKDLKKGAPIKAGTATAAADVDVPVGSGQVDMAAVLRAARGARISAYYLEDESADPWGHIPQSVAYLGSVSPTAR